MNTLNSLSNKSGAKHPVRFFKVGHLRLVFFAVRIARFAAQTLLCCA
jgi:hypothetical protein